MTDAPPAPAPWGLYLHVPFCARRCSYCDFATEASPAPPVERLARCLALEWERRPVAFQRTAPATVYFGGGSPSLLSASFFQAMLQRVLGDARAVEVTVEANPGQVTPEWLGGLRRAGVNRLSLGVQSLDDATLALLGRMHDTRQALEAVRLAREAGFKHLGADLILGTPLGGHPRPAEDAVRLAGLGVDHLSAYLLSVEDGTPLERDLSAGRLHLPSEEQAAAQYLAVSRALAGLGFSHYEVSNHSLPGAEARHNAAYWALQPYLGLGPSAVSCLPGESGDGGTRWGNREAFEAWAAALEAGFAPTAWSETRDAQVSRAERLFLAFRTSQGLDLADLGRRWGPGAAEALRGRLEGFQRSGWVTRQDQRYTATEEGWLRSNALLAELLIALEAT